MMRGAWRALALMGWCAATAQALADVRPLPARMEVRGVEFVLIPAGTFPYTVENGEPATHADGRPWFRTVNIHLDDFYIARYEARAGDLAAFLNSGAAQEAIPELSNKWANARADSRNNEGFGCTVVRDAGGKFAEADPGGDLPATNLSWRLAEAFARWMGFDLPTEAQWQKAARGQEPLIWPWGDDYPDDTFALFANVGPECVPMPVTAYPKGQSRYGVFNMAGNVAEFVVNWYNETWDAALQDGMRDPPPPGEGEFRGEFHGSRLDKIYKGSGWGNDPYNHTVAMRRYARIDKARDFYGVRFALGGQRARELLARAVARPLAE